MAKLYPISKSAKELKEIHRQIDAGEAHCKVCGKRLTKRSKSVVVDSDYLTFLLPAHLPCLDRATTEENFEKQAEIDRQKEEIGNG